MALLQHIMNQQHNRRLPRPRVFCDTCPLETLTDTELVARYRLPHHSIMELCDIVQQNIHRVTHRSHPLTVATQVLMALRFHATGCMQTDVGNLHGISQPSASRLITGVSAAIACVARNYISLPQSNLTEIMQDFGEVANIPNGIQLCSRPPL